MATTQDAPLRMLVPVDGSALADQAIAHAATLACEGDEIRLLHVAPYPRPPQTYRGDDLTMTEQDLEKFEEDARGVVAKSASIWRKLIPNAIQETEYGDPADRILKVAAREKIDLIVMASHGRGALGRWRYGSVADRVARTSPAPVLIVRPYDAEEGFGPAQIHRFIVPLDGSDLAAQALPIAERLAKRMHRPINLVRVAPSSLLPTTAFGAVAAESVAHDAAISAEREAAESLEETAVQLRAAGIAVNWDVEIGEAFERITDAAKHGDVIVLASHGRSGLDRWMLGSVAEKLIRLADAPVLVVRAQPVPAA